MLTRSGSGQISARIRPEPDPDLFFKLISGRIRIQAKNGRVRPDPEPDLRSSRFKKKKFDKTKCLYVLQYLSYKNLENAEMF